jgi:membrane protein DedA with SNARE-associated domain
MFDGVALSKYLGVVGMLIGAGLGLPIPEEIPIVTAGAFVGHDAYDLTAPDLYAAVGGGPMVLHAPAPGGTRWWIMLPLCIVAVVFSDSLLYFAGRWFGPWILARKWVQKKILTPEKRAKIEANFEKRGVMILLAARFTPGIRTPVFLMAGVLRMPVLRFVLADGLYAIPGVNLLFWLAYWFTDQFVEAVKAVERHKPMAVVAVLAAVGGVILYKVLVGRTASTGDPDEIPAPLKRVGAVTYAVEQTIERTVEKTGEAAAFVFDKMTHPFGHQGKDLTPRPPLQSGEGEMGPPSVSEGVASEASRGRSEREPPPLPESGRGQHAGG